MAAKFGWHGGIFHFKMDLDVLSHKLCDFWLQMHTDKYKEEGELTITFTNAEKQELLPSYLSY